MAPRGSALYAIPSALSRSTAFGMGELSIANWNHPPRFTTMNAPTEGFTGSMVTLKAERPSKRGERYTSRHTPLCSRQNELALPRVATQSGATPCVGAQAPA